MEIEYYGNADLRKEEINKGHHHNEKNYFLDIKLTIMLSSGVHHDVDKISLSLNAYIYDELKKQLEKSSSNSFEIKRGHLELKVLN